MYGDMANQRRGVVDHRTATNFLLKCGSCSVPNTYILHFTMDCNDKNINSCYFYIELHHFPLYFDMLLPPREKAR